MRTFAFQTAFDALHEYRGHTRKRSALHDYLTLTRCTCVADVTAVFNGLLDSGFFIVRSDQ